MREFVLLRWLCALAVTSLLCIAVARPIRAQVATRLDLGGVVEVGSEAERYLRVLQLTDSLSMTPWTILPFSATSEGLLAPADSHPWRARFPATAGDRPFKWLRPVAALTVNTTFPVQAAVGPVWTGRGVTVGVQYGLAARWGHVRLQLAPIAFLAQNASFPLAPNEESGALRFADARFPRVIDLPQRFGESAYSRVDAGTSVLAIDAAGIDAGISNEPQRWGPAREYPLLLGPAAGGFPHAFIGTAKPVDLWLAQAQVRLIAGSLAQSAYSAALPGATERNLSAAVLAFMPRGLTGLELGMGRVFESTNPLTLERILRPFDIRALVGAVGNPSKDVNVPNENQLASAFFRWVFPAAGFAIHGEWYREDFPGDFRKFVLKPDDLSSFMLGFERVFVSSRDRRRVARFEVVNGELSHQERGQRGFDHPIPPYVHSEVVQGHTQRGLLLASPEAYGGAGWRVSLDDYTPDGRVTLGLEHALRGDWLPGAPATEHPDVVYAARVEAMRFAGGRDWTVIAVPAIDLNRNLVAGASRLNLNLSVRAGGW